MDSPIPTESQASPDPTAKYFPIVGIGASAGGLEAFTLLLKHLPTDTGLGFVLVQHLDPQHESALTQLLARATAMPVCEVTDNLRVEANHVYVIPPNTNLHIARGVLKLQPRERSRAPARSIDSFFESLARDRRERAIGVILSGTASDGTMGLEAIKAGDGITFAQNDSARYDSMPRSAIAAGCVDFVLKPEDIARELARIARHPLVAGRSTRGMVLREAGRATGRGGDKTSLAPGVGGAPLAGAGRVRGQTGLRPANGGDAGFKRIIDLLHDQSGVDFSRYKSASVQRRITRRVVLNKLNTLVEYARFLRGNTRELDALCSDVLISVTDFFRNPEAFDILRCKIFPKLLQQRRNEPLRVWVPGCSTGQEAYSIAMTFAESTGNTTTTRPRKLQVFATDLNNAVLNQARHGLYPKTLADDVSPERLRRFFVEEEAGYRVAKPLREMVVFARQNLISDPPFSRMDLISCRNLLIYLDPELQKKAISTFHYALKPGGFLFLGASESIGGLTDLFGPTHKTYKIYSRKTTPTPPFHPPVGEVGEERSPSARRPLQSMEKWPGLPADGLRGELNLQREADRVMVNQFAPPGVLVNAQLQILQFRGPTGDYLQPPPAGKAVFDVLKMAREGLLLPLRATINKARKENRVARRDNVRVGWNGAGRSVNLEVIPLRNAWERCFLVLFKEVEKLPRSTPGVPPPEPAHGRAGTSGTTAKREESPRLAALESELSETRDYLQSIQEQHEAANGELQASNEEVQSANEELQSLNEELETSKEELESTNEELVTVNQEMINRNAELNHLNADLGNLQSSIKLPVVLLGRDLIIRRFSAPAEKIFNFLAIDVGRPLGAIRHNLVVPETEPAASGARRIAGSSPRQGGNAAPFPVEALVREVIDTAREEEREVRDQEGRWYSLRVRPYLKVGNKVDGAVLVLMDITDLKRNEREVKTARNYAEAIIRTARDPLLILRADLRVNTANEAFYKTFKTTPGRTEGRLIYDLCERQWDIPKLRRLLGDILPRNSFFNDFEVTLDIPKIGARTLLLNARQVESDDGVSPLVLLAFEDVTERQHASEATTQLAAVVQATDDAIFTKTLTGVVTSWNPGAERMYGYSAREMVGENILSLIPPGRAGELERVFAQLRRGERVENFETERRRKDGSIAHVSLSVAALRDKNGQLAGASAIARDITERKEADERVRLSEIRYRRLFEAAHDGVLILDSVSRKITDANPYMTELLGYPREDLLDRELWQIGLLKDERASHAAFRELQKKKVIRYDDLPLRTKSGGECAVEVVANLYGENGREVIQCNIRDITERKRAEEALRASEERYRTLFDLSPMAVYSTDVAGVIQKFNRRAAELWGREPAPGDTDAHFCGSFKLLRPDGSVMPHDQCPMAEVLSGKIPEACDAEVIIERPAGSRSTVVVNIHALQSPRGQIIGAINCFYDITERKRVEEALRLAQARLAGRAGQLEKAVAGRTEELTNTNKQLEAFAYSIAHDLRAPLRAMQGFSTMLVEEAGAALSEAGRGYAATINRSAQFMDDLLTGLLAFSRISQLQIELTEVNLQTMVDAVFSHLQQNIQETNARVENSGPWPVVLAHEPTLIQVLFNLVNNALKFATANVPPVVRLRTEERSGFVRVWVEDNGIGIAPDYQEQIFRLFNRLNGETYPGTGIGLAIVQKGVERMGGRMGLESTPGQGSRFWFELRKAEGI